MEVSNLVLAVDSRQVKRASSDLDGLSASGRRVETATGGLTRAMGGLRSVLGGLALGVLAKQALQAADTYANMNARLSLVTKSATEFAAAQKSLFDIAQRTRVGLEQTSELFGSLARSTDALGVSQSELLGVTETINQALKVSGTNAQSAAAALVQLGQGFASGALRGEELNSVLAQAPRLAQAIADGLGVAQGDLRALGQEGELTAEKVFRALQKSSGAIKSEFDRLPLTVDQATTQVSTSLLRLIGTIDELTGTSSTIASWASQVSSSLDTVADRVKNSGGVFAAFGNGLDLIAGSNVLINKAAEIRQLTESAEFLKGKLELAEARGVAPEAATLKRYEAIRKQLVTLQSEAQVAKDRLLGVANVTDPLKTDQSFDRLEARRFSGAIDPEIKRGRQQSALSQFLKENATDREKLDAEIKKQKELLGELFTPELEARLRARFTKKSADTGKLTAQDLLGFDNAKIKRELDVLTSSYGAAEAILDAQRSAGQVGERAYYEAKRGFIRLNADAEIAALEAENARLAKTKGNDREQLESRRQIADNEARIAGLRADSAAKLEVLSIQESGALAKVKQAYKDAEISAQAYIETVNRRNARDIEGIGKGEKFRREQSGRSDIEDKFTTQRQGLEDDLRRRAIEKEDFDKYLKIAKQTYELELQAYDARNAAIAEKQASWLEGANEAFANYQDNAANVAASTTAMFSTAFDGLTDGVANSVTESLLYGKSLEDGLKAVAVNVAESFIASFIKIQIQRLIVDKLAAAGYAGTVAAQSQAQVAMAGLNAFASTAAIPVVGPAAAPGAAAAAVAVAQGFAAAATTAALAGVASARGGFDIPAGVNPMTQLHEREMVLPAKHADVIRSMADGKGTQGGGGGITIVNNTRATIGKATEQRLPNGERALILEEAIEAVASQMSDPNSRVSRSMGRNFSLQRSR